MKPKTTASILLSLSICLTGCAAEKGSETEETVSSLYYDSDVAAEVMSRFPEEEAYIYDVWESYLSAADKWLAMETWAASYVQLYSRSPTYTGLRYAIAACESTKASMEFLYSTYGLTVDGEVLRTLYENGIDFSFISEPVQLLKNYLANAPGSWQSCVGNQLYYSVWEYSLEYYAAWSQNMLDMLKNQAEEIKTLTNALLHTAGKKESCDLWQTWTEKYTTVFKSGAEWLSDPADIEKAWDLHMERQKEIHLEQTEIGGMQNANTELIKQSSEDPSILENHCVFFDESYYPVPLPTWSGDCMAEVYSFCKSEETGASMLTTACSLLNETPPTDLVIEWADISREDFLAYVKILEGFGITTNADYGARIDDVTGQPMMYVKDAWICLKWLQDGTATVELCGETTMFVPQWYMRPFQAHSNGE